MHPYEIHITVSGANTINLVDFKQTCHNMGVKPLLIEAHNKSGDITLLDCQTSSVFNGDDTSIMVEVSRISGGLTAGGYTVIREKVETVPWHPLAPSEGGSTHMPDGCYFECHFNILVDNDNYEHLKNILKGLPVHISRNAFKEFKDNFVVMATVRNARTTREGFEQQHNHIKSHLENNGFEVPKTIIEFSLFDSNINHDRLWVAT